MTTSERGHLVRATPPVAVPRPLRLDPEGGPARRPPAAALRALDAGLPASRVACLARYSDQAHLIREVKAMTGLTPATLTRRRAASWRPTDRSQTEITSVFLA
ncbi:hypothetical protein ACFQZ4_04430 [Catellatospora coxensis]